MSSIAGDSFAGRLHEDAELDPIVEDTSPRASLDGAEENDSMADVIGEIKNNELRENGTYPQASTLQDELGDSGSEELNLGPRTPPPASPADSGSIPDDTLSLPGSQVSTPARIVSSPRGSVSRTPSGALQPFERRFQSRLSASPSSPSRPAFLGSHSRQVSLSSQILSQGSETREPPLEPWEVVRWTRLRKITGQVFSEIGKRQFGSPTCFAVSAAIIVGTSRGLILVFDYHQTLKNIIGQGTKATECGAITSLAIAADYAVVAGGHASGNIFTWEIEHAAKPFLHVNPVSRTDAERSPDGHVPGRAVLHVGFLGTRHTALVSADDCGMAFSHLASRGLGAIIRNVKTTRLLGRYPSPLPQESDHKRPSSVLAFAPLPLGNVEEATDSMGLTAILTPYLLVIVSTTPLAQTQHKAARPKDVALHGAMSGCLAWFPAVRLKTAKDGQDTSKTKLVYCWSDVLTVLEIEVGASDPQNNQKQPTLLFHERSRWRCEEAIVAVQWLSRSVIGLLTISQRLVILEDPSLHAMDSVDLLHKHIYHRDFFSEQLHSIVEQSENESSMHGVIADAFSMSFRAYKGRLFLMGFSDVEVGTVSNWADRLSALVENGDDIGAIRLAVTYYNGVSGKVSVGLPEDADSRHEVVRERLLDLLTASIKYRFSKNAPEVSRLRELTAECFDACLTVDQSSFLLEDLYDLYKEAGEEAVILDMVETYIMDDEITALPPTLVKDLVNHYVSNGKADRLEEMLCRLDARTFDIDQVTRLCREFLLFEALIHVWNQALADWITPLVELLGIIRDIDCVGTDSAASRSARENTAMKVFPYLAFSLTGRQYPQGEPIEDDQATSAKHNLYSFLLSHEPTTWPLGSSEVVRTHHVGAPEPAFPYLRLLLEFDTSNFMSMLNEAFEDPFLNPALEQSDDYSISALNGVGGEVTRQQIISILQEIMSPSEFAFEQRIYLDIFIARSLPKYPQYMILSGSSLQSILAHLTSFRSDDLSEECQLSVEYLLSVYHPSVTPDLIAMLRDAGFHRVLKSIYRSERQYTNLIRTYFEDQMDQDAVFADLEGCFRDPLPLTQKNDLDDLLCAHATQLAFIDLSATAQTLSKCRPALLPRFIEALQEERLQFAFLRDLLEPSYGDHFGHRNLDAQPTLDLVSRFSEQYIQHMCVHDPTHVADYLNTLGSADLQLDHLLPALEEHGVIDAAVVLLARDDSASDAMDRLERHLEYLNSALCSLIAAAAESPDAENTVEAILDLVESIDKYAKLGVWLCNGQSNIADRQRRPAPRKGLENDIQEGDLDMAEYLWLTLVDVIVTIAKDVSAAAKQLSSVPSVVDPNKAVTSVRSLVQQVFTALLSATAAPRSVPERHQIQQPQVPRLPSSTHSNQGFLRVFRLFLNRAAKSAPSLSDLRAVLLDIFSAYAYETNVLDLANQLLGSDVFGEIDEVRQLRQRGWRPKSQVCEHCKRRAWGTGIGERIWDAWHDNETDRLKKREARYNADGQEPGRGKGRETAPAHSDQKTDVSKEELSERKKMTLVVFACRHVFHRHCLNEMSEVEIQATRNSETRYECPVCKGK